VRSRAEPSRNVLRPQTASAHLPRSARKADRGSIGPGGRHEPSRGEALGALCRAQACNLLLRCRDGRPGALPAIRGQACYVGLAMP
jgi:hypothetical protein